MGTVGQRIRARRIELGLSQDELAQRLGYGSRSSINKIELDKRDLPQSKIVAIARALGTTPDYIMGWDEAPDDDERLERLLAFYNRLTGDGKERVLAYLEDLNGKYYEGGGNDAD